jgi:hypothetical protein
MTITGPLKGRPQQLRHSMKEFHVLGYRGALIQTPIQVRAVVTEQSCDLKQANTHACVIDCRAYPHRASSLLPPCSVAELKDVAFHDFCEGCQQKSF